MLNFEALGNGLTEACLASQLSLSTDSAQQPRGPSPRVYQAASFGPGAGPALSPSTHTRSAPDGQGGFGGPWVMGTQDSYTGSERHGKREGPSVSQATGTPCIPSRPARDSAGAWRRASEATEGPRTRTFPHPVPHPFPALPPGNPRSATPSPSPPPSGNARSGP